MPLAARAVCSCCWGSAEGIWAGVSTRFAGECGAVGCHQGCCAGPGQRADAKPSLVAE